MMAWGRFVARAYDGDASCPIRAAFDGPGSAKNAATWLYPRISRTENAADVVWNVILEYDIRARRVTDVGNVIRDDQARDVFEELSRFFKDGSPEAILVREVRTRLGWI